MNQTSDVQVYRKVLNTGKSKALIAMVFNSENPLTLKQSLALANMHNEQLAMAGENYLQALINKNRAFAAFLPRISFAPVFMRQEKSALGAGNAGIAGFTPHRTTDVSVTGKLDLNPFRDLPVLKAAGYSEQMQRALLLDRRAVLMIDVAKTYFQVMHSEKQVQVLQYSIKVGQQSLRDILVKQKAGVVRSVDVFRIEDRLAKTRNSLILAKKDVKKGRAMLAFLIGVPAVNGPLTNGINVPSTNWRIKALLKPADTHRQDLIAAREQVKVAAAELKAAWGEYFPSVSLNLAYYLSRDTFPNDVDWTSLLRVNIPIFSAGLVHADVRTAYSRLRQARLAESYISRKVLKDLRVAVENLNRDREEINQVDIQVKAAQEELHQADAGLKAGLGTELEQMTAKDGLLSAEFALSTVMFNENIDYLSLLRATGMLNPDISVKLPSSEKTFHGTNAHEANLNLPRIRPENHKF